MNFWPCIASFLLLIHSCANTRLTFHRGGRGICMRRSPRLAALSLFVPTVEGAACSTSVTLVGCGTKGACAGGTFSIAAGTVSRGCTGIEPVLRRDETSRIRSAALAALGGSGPQPRVRSSLCDARPKISAQVLAWALNRRGAAAAILFNRRRRVLLACKTPHFRARQIRLRTRMTRRVARLLYLHLPSHSAS